MISCFPTLCFPHLDIVCMKKKTHWSLEEKNSCFHLLKRVCFSWFSFQLESLGLWWVGFGTCDVHHFTKWTFKWSCHFVPGQLVFYELLPKHIYKLWEWLFRGVPLLTAWQGFLCPVTLWSAISTSLVILPVHVLEQQLRLEKQMIQLWHSGTWEHQGPLFFTGILTNGSLHI